MNFQCFLCWKLSDDFSITVDTGRTVHSLRLGSHRTVPGVQRKRPETSAALIWPTNSQRNDRTDAAAIRCRTGNTADGPDRQESSR